MSARLRTVGAFAGVAAVTVVLLAATSMARRPHPARGAARPAAKTHFIPQSVSFVSPSVGWAWGPAGWPLAGRRERGVLARTSNGGRTWSTVPSPGPYAQPGYGPGFSGVHFADNRHGYLFGSRLLETGDGGETWRQIRVPGMILDVETAGGDAYAQTLTCANEDICGSARLYRVGSERLVGAGPRSPVSGRWWSLVARGASVYLLTPNTTGLGSTLWSSHDGGWSWRSERGPCQWTGVLAAWSSSGLALACGWQPAAGSQLKTFYESPNGGRSWRPVGQLPFGPGYIQSLAAANPEHWVIGEARGQIIVTTDGGRDWRAAHFLGPTDGVEGWGSIGFIDGAHAVAVPWTMNGDVIAFSEDAGSTWRELAFGAIPPAG